MQFSRKQMEEEADRLGVPWTHATTDEQLHALIQSRVRGEPMTEPNETVDHECLGLFWDFPKEDACKECSGQQKCFQQFCATTFPNMQAKLGPGATLAQLAKALDVSQEAVLVAMNQQSKAAPAPVPEPEPEEPEELEEEEVVEEEEGDPEDEFEDADELEDELEEEPEEVEEEEEPPEPEPEPEPPSEMEMAAKKKTTKKKTPAKKKATSKKAPAKKKASTKKAPAKKAPAKKAPTPPPVSSEVQDPTQAESAKTATGSAKSKAQAKSASRAKGQAGPSKTGGASKGSKVRKAKPKKKPAKKPAKKKPSRVAHVEDPWGEHTFLPRYERERKRSKLIAALRPGMKLKREYQGETHEVTVLKQFYRYKGEVYPTLYSIVKEITGTKEAPRQLDKDGKRPKGTRQLCNWSAPKFFNLKA